MSPLRISFAAVISLLLLGAFPETIKAADAPVSQDYLNQGYYLIHKLADDESQLPLLLIIKHHPPKIGAFADEVSRTGKATMAAIEGFQKADSSIHFDKNPLPPFEQDTRTSIRAEKQHMLLFGTTNSAFLRYLLVSQIEATTYGKNLIEVMVAHEKDPDRVKTLQDLEAQWSARQGEAYRLLADY